MQDKWKKKKKKKGIQERWIRGPTTGFENNKQKKPKNQVHKKSKLYLTNYHLDYEIYVLAEYSS